VARITLWTRCTVETVAHGGGGLFYDTSVCRSAYRRDGAPGIRDVSLGLHLLREVR